MTVHGRMMASQAPAATRSLSLAATQQGHALPSRGATVSGSRFPLVNVAPSGFQINMVWIAERQRKRLWLCSEWIEWIRSVPAEGFGRYTKTEWQDSFELENAARREAREEDFMRRANNLQRLMEGPLRRGMLGYASDHVFMGAEGGERKCAAAARDGGRACSTSDPPRVCLAP